MIEETTPAVADDLAATATDASSDATDLQPVSSAATIEKLTQFYETQEEQGSQVQDENAEAGDENDSVEETEEIENQPEEDAGNSGGEEESAEREAEAGANAAADADEPGAADFDALEEKPVETIEYLDIERLKEKYPRQRKEFYEEAARYSQEAQKGREAIEKIGGEDFIAPLAFVRDGIESKDTSKILQGIVEMADEGAAVKFVADSMMVGLVQAKAFQANPDTKEFGDAMQQYSDAVLQARFGDGMSAEQIERLSAFSQIGWIDAVQRWKEQGFVDSDEFDQLVEADADPEQFQSLRQENNKLKLELEKATSQQKPEEKETAREQRPTPDAAKDDAVLQEVTDGLIKVQKEVVLAKSVLSDRDGDTDEMKTEKGFLRSRLTEQAKAHVRAHADYSKLVAAYNRGESNTEDFRDLQARIINASLLQTKEQTSVAERIMAKIYGKTRNGSLAQKKAGATAATDTSAAQEKELRPPTMTTEFSSTDKPKTLDEIYANLERQFQSGAG